MYVVDDYETTVACKGETLRVKCSSSKRIAVHSAMYGHQQDGTVRCSNATAYDTGETSLRGFGYSVHRGQVASARYLGLKFPFLFVYNHPRLTWTLNTDSRQTFFSD